MPLKLPQVMNLTARALILTDLTGSSKPLADLTASSIGSKKTWKPPLRLAAFFDTRNSNK